MSEPTLHEALAAIGWSSRAATELDGLRMNCRLVFDATGAEVGWLSAGETWEMLRERGLIAASTLDMERALHAAVDALTDAERDGEPGSIIVRLRKRRDDAYEALSERYAEEQP